MQCKDIPDDVAIQAAADAMAAGYRPDVVSLLIERTGAPSKVVYSKLQRLVDRGLLNFGVSLRGCWPERRDDGS